MDKPLVSVCIPVRNAGRWLRQAIDSALGQSWGQTEVVVVDDGSTDDSRAIMESYRSQIVAQSDSARGGNAARNRALSLARGEWIQFLDADDYLLPDKIESQWEEADGFAGCDLILSPEWRETWRGDAALGRESQALPEGDDWFAQWFAWQWPGTQGGLWRRATLETLGAWNESMPCCQDYELYARALRAGTALRWTSKPLSVYRVWSEQTVSRRDPRQLIEVKTQLIDSMVDFLRERGEWTALRATAAGRTCFEMSRTLALIDLDEAARYSEKRESRGLLRVDGPAAPMSYRLARRVLGFTGAERLARAMR